MGTVDQLASQQAAGAGRGSGNLPRRSRLVYWVPALLLLGIVALFLHANRHLLHPAVKVTAERAVAVKALAQDLQGVAEGQVLFQASGWIEPEPYMVKAAAFVEGLVAEVRVLNGQLVHRGDVLATLDDKSLRLVVTEGETELAALEGELKVVSGRVAVAHGEVALVHKRKATAEAELARLQLTSDILQKSGDALPLLQREDARLVVERQRKLIQEVDSEHDLREASVAVAKAEQEAARQRIASRNASLARMRLDLERTVIRAPMEGIVQKVYVRTGQKLMLAGDNMDSATVADLYDPKRLQVRVDVALADAGGLAVGMSARIVTDILPGVKFAGMVTSIAGQADLAKNTLQAKVKLTAPDIRLRPEMLARVEFMPAPRMDAGAVKNDAPQGMVYACIPESAITGKPQDGRAEVWVAAGGGTIAEKRKVSLGAATLQGWREVREGVNPGELIILSSRAQLSPGRRIAVQPPTAGQP